MPVEFLTAEQEASYGCFAGDPTEAELAQSFYLDGYCLSKFISLPNHNFSLNLAAGCAGSATFLFDAHPKPFFSCLLCGKWLFGSVTKSYSSERKAALHGTQEQSRRKELRQKRDSCAL